MNLAEKDKYIAEHLINLESDTLRFMVADHVSQIQRMRETLELIAAASLGKTGPDARGQLETIKKIAKGVLAESV